MTPLSDGTVLIELDAQVSVNWEGELYAGTGGYGDPRRAREARGNRVSEANNGPVRSALIGFDSRVPASVPRPTSFQPGEPRPVAHDGSASSGEALPDLSERELFWAGVFVCVPGVILAGQGCGRSRRCCGVEHG